MTTTTESDQTSLAALMAQQGDEVMPDGTLQTGTTMSKGGGVTLSRSDGQVAEGEARVEDLAFKGYVTVWDNRTGRAVLQPKWILWQTFSLKRPDGSRIFTNTDPKIPQNYGLNLACRLHPESNDYELLKDMGFNSCSKRHTPTKIALDDHMRHSHKRAYAVLKDADEAHSRAEDRELQREVMRSNQALIAAMAEAATGQKGEAVAKAPLYVSDKPKRQRRKRKTQ